jgi:hypothetical protein
MRDLRLFVGFIVLLVLSEILLVVNELVGVIFYSLWLLVLIIVLTTKLIEKRDLFVVLTTIPLIRMVSLLMPLKAVNYTFVVYIILLIISLMQIYNLKINIHGLYKSKNLAYLLLLLPLFGVSILEYKLVNTKVMPLEYWSIALVVFASIAYILFFLYVIQNSLEKAFGSKGVVFTGILMTVVGISQQNVIGIGLTFLMSLTLALIYSESRNWLLVAGLLSFLNVMALIVLPYGV